MSAQRLISGCLLICTVVTLGAGASSARAQTEPAPQPQEAERCPNGKIRDFTGNVKSDAIIETVASSTATAISQKPTTAAAPPAFADRVNASIADFLPWFQFAVNEVTSSEDKTSVTAKLNPIPVGMYGNLSLNATASQPQVFKALEEEIVEPAREAERKKLIGKVDDFSDLTFALAYGLQWRAGTWNNTRKLFGRNYELYRNLASDLLAEALKAPLGTVDEATDRIARVRRRLLDENKSVFEEAAVRDGLARRDDAEKLQRFDEICLATVKAVNPAVHEQFIDVLRQEALLSADVTAKAREVIASNKLDALPAMIDNQPQIIFQGSYRLSDDIIGRDTWAITANYEMGSRNLNAMLREYHQMRNEGIQQPSYLEAFRRGVADRAYKYEDKVIFSASFRRNEPYSFTYDYKEAVSVPGSDTPAEIGRTASLDLPRSDDWRASLSWTRLWPRPTETQQALLPNLAAAGIPQLPLMTGRQDPRSTLTVEWVDADQGIKVNGKPLENDRLVARLSLIVPVQGGMTLPLTIVYSDNPEFLKDQDRVFGAHVGISYKIGEKGAAATGQ